MPENTEFPEHALPDAPGQPRASAGWLIPVAGIIVVALLALTSIILIWRYMASRPVDLVPANAAMVGHIEDLLAMTPLPRGSVKRYEPILRTDDEARWNVHMFDVGVPPNFPVNDIVMTLKHGTALQDISIAETEAPLKQERELRFAMLDREFAIVRIVGGAERYEFTTVCTELAHGVKNLLGTAPGVREVESLRQEDRQDGPIRWRTYTLRATVDYRASTTGLHALLSESLGEFHGEQPDVSLAGPSRRIEVSLRNRPVVQLELVGFSAPYVPLKDFLADPGLLYEISPLLFRSLFGFDPKASGISTQSHPAVPEDGELMTQAPAHDGADTPRAAIIVDDGGYGGLASDAILSMDPRLTLAILPGTPFARETTETGTSRGFEVLVHMPLESGNPHAPYPGELTTAMAPAELEAQVAAALEDVPGARGMNNHTGSEFTANEAAMKRFLAILKERGMFFVDSRTTAETVAECVARRMGVPVARRSVFLDNEPEPDHILEQAVLLADTAVAEGVAIGICHFRSTTAAILPEVIRVLDALGVALVHVSELVQ